MNQNNKRARERAIKDAARTIQRLTDLPYATARQIVADDRHDLLPDRWQATLTADVIADLADPDTPASPATVATLLPAGLPVAADDATVRITASPHSWTLTANDWSNATRDDGTTVNLDVAADCPDGARIAAATVTKCDLATTRITVVVQYDGGHTWAAAFVGDTRDDNAHAYLEAGVTAVWDTAVDAAARLGVDDFPATAADSDAPVSAYYDIVDDEWADIIDVTVPGRVTAGDEIEVVLVDHRHGHDIVVGLPGEHTDSDALLASYARTWWDEAVDAAPHLPATPPDDDEQAAIDYFEAMGDTEGAEVMAATVA